MISADATNARFTITVVALETLGDRELCVVVTIETTNGISVGQALVGMDACANTIKQR